MVSLSQGIVDRVTARVTKAVTDSVTKSVTDSVTKAVTEKKDKEFAAKLEKLEQERVAKDREKEREQERDREQLAVRLVAEGLSIDVVARLAKLPESTVQALVASQASMKPLDEQPR